MKPKRTINYLTRYGGQTERAGRDFRLDASDWNALLLFTSARVAWGVALNSMGYREAASAIPVRLYSSGGSTGTCDYEMSDGSVRGLTPAEAVRLKNMTSLAAEISRSFADEPPLRADLLSDVEAMQAASAGVAHELGRIEKRNSGGVFATLHLEIT